MTEHNPPFHKGIFHKQVLSLDMEINKTHYMDFFFSNVHPYFILASDPTFYFIHSSLAFS